MKVSLARSVPEPSSASGPLPSAAAAETCTVPPEMVVPPLWVLVPVSVSVPAPVLLRQPVPETAPEKVELVPSPPVIRQ